MAIADTRLRIFAFPQAWDGGDEISLRVLVAPFGNPLQPLDSGLPPFAGAQLALTAHLIPNLDQLPRPVDVSDQVPLDDVTTPPDIADVYEALSAQFSIDPTAPAAYVPPQKTRFLKMLMPSYLEATGFAQPRTDLAVTDNRFICALVDGPPPQPRPPTPAVPPKWDTVLAMAIRQPLLAERLGLIYVSSLTLPSDTFYANGGWLYVTLGTASDYVAAAQAPDFLKLYGARIPPLRAGVPASLFAPVLFPVQTTPPAGSYDEMLHEAERYADGFARVVHTFQPDRADYLNLARQDDAGPRLYEESGLKLGWDDEQIVIWLNRQLTDDPRNGSPVARDTPMGVRGFRVDVREAGGGSWTSLVRMRGPIQVGNIAIGAFDGEMAIELAPSQLQGKRDGDYWLPPYFTQWAGASLIAPDPTSFKVAGHTPGPRVLSPAGHRDVPLGYGQSYQFRVRMTDLTGGGPDAGASNEPVSGVATCRFRRFVPPGSPRVANAVENGDGSVTFAIGRPHLGYPALTYTPLPNAEARLLADAPTATAEHRPASYPDPDIARIRIDVTVGALEYDPGNEPDPEPRRHLYSTFRDFDDDPEQPLDLTLEFVDETDLAAFPAPAPTGRLRLPTARTIELAITPLARRDPGMSASLADPLTAVVVDVPALDADDPNLLYFGKQATRVGKRHIVKQRRESGTEADLFQEIPSVPFQGIFLQPSAAHDVQLHTTNAASGTQEQAPETAVQRLARQLHLENRELTLSAEAGQRVVFGAAAAVRHVLSPEHSTITFADETEITSQWLMAIPLRLARDWTWDALTDEGLRVFRSINGGPREPAGVISPRKSLSMSVVRAGVLLQRSFTDLFFLDAIDPKPAPGEFPSELEVTYTVVPQFRQAPATPTPEWTSTIRVPIAAPPTQVPQVASAGIALSPFERDAAYSQTEPRRRMLWVEFAEPVANPRDAYFARVTAYASDPMLMREEPAPPPSPLEPPLNIDAEPMRAIVVGQPEDSSGLAAMQPLIAADGAAPVRHFLLPLPAALSGFSPELFGFFVYEFRVGHAEGWSTAQARFGLAQRLTGVQHPAPHLNCSVTRVADHIRVSAPFATPVAAGQSVRAEPPCSDLWALLYVQVRLADASDWRNVLIGRARMTLSDRDVRGRSGATPHGVGYWDQAEIEAWLDALGLPHNSPLSVLAVELLPEPDSPFTDPLGKELGHVRVLRTSPLTPVPAICVDG